jgi:hypothetical protein
LNVQAGAIGAVPEFTVKTSPASAALAMPDPASRISVFPVRRCDVLAK